MRMPHLNSTPAYQRSAQPSLAMLLVDVVELHILLTVIDVIDVTYIICACPCDREIGATLRSLLITVVQLYMQHVSAVELGCNNCCHNSTDKSC